MCLNNCVYVAYRSAGRTAIVRRMRQNSDKGGRSSSLGVDKPCPVLYYLSDQRGLWVGGWSTHPGLPEQREDRRLNGGLQVHSRKSLMDDTKKDRKTEKDRIDVN